MDTLRVGKDFRLNDIDKVEGCPMAVQMAGKHICLNFCPIHQNLGEGNVMAAKRVAMAIYVMVRNICSTTTNYEADYVTNAGADARNANTL